MASNLYLPSIKRNSNFANIFNNEGIIPLIWIYNIGSIFHNGKKNKTTELYLLLILASTRHYHDDIFPERLDRLPSICFRTLQHQYLVSIIEAMLDV